MSSESTFDTTIIELAKEYQRLELSGHPLGEWLPQFMGRLPPGLSIAAIRDYAADHPAPEAPETESTDTPSGSAVRGEEAHAPAAGPTAPETLPERQLQAVTDVRKAGSPMRTAVAPMSRGATGQLGVGVSQSDRSRRMGSIKWAVLVGVLIILVVVFGCIVVLFGKPMYERVFGGTETPSVEPTPAALLPAGPTITLAPIFGTPNAPTLQPTTTVAVGAQPTAAPTIAPATPVSPVTVASTIMGTAKGSNIRDGPSTAYRIIGQLAQGESVQVTAKSSNTPSEAWFQVVWPEAPNQRAWVKAILVTLDPTLFPLIPLEPAK